MPNSVLVTRLMILASALVFGSILYFTFTHPADGWGTGTEAGNRFMLLFSIAAAVPYALLFALTFTTLTPPDHFSAIMLGALVIAFPGYALYGHGSPFFLLGGVLTNFVAVFLFLFNRWLKT